DGPGAGLCHGLPESAQRLARPLVAAERQSIGGDRSIQGPRACSHDSFDGDAPVFENPVESAPGQGTIRTATLQSEVDGRAVGPLSISCRVRQALLHPKLSVVASERATRAIVGYMLRLQQGQGQAAQLQINYGGKQFIRRAGTHIDLS